MPPRITSSLFFADKDRVPYPLLSEILVIDAAKNPKPQKQGRVPGQRSKPSRRHAWRWDR